MATTITGVPDRRFPAAIEATAYFVVSEAVANVAKHDDGAGGARPAAPSWRRTCRARDGPSPTARRHR